MNFELSLVIFTVFSQFAVGLSIFLCIDTFAIAKEKGDEEGRRKGWFWAFIVCLIGLVASLFHLGHPLQAYKALYNLGDSWLSREALIFALFCALAFFNISFRSRLLALATAALGCFGLVAQGLTYAPPAIPALNNAFPLTIFLLSALALGATSRAFMYPVKTGWIARPCMVALTAIILIAPAIWLSGTTTMKLSGSAWLASPLFWIGITLIVLALVVSFWQQLAEKTQIACLLSGIILTRIVFFADSFHTAGNLGLPFN